MTAALQSLLRRRLLVIIAVAVVLLAVGGFHLTQGAAGHITDAVLFGSRLPRMTAGIVAGVALGVAGCLVQGVTRNPLASSDTLGVNAGAYLGVVAVTVFIPAVPLLALLAGGVAAFIGGGAAMAMVWLLTSGAPRTPGRVLLAGAALTFVASAVASLLLMFHEQQSGQLYFWGNGSLLQNSMLKPTIMGGVVVVAVASALALSRPLDLLRLGDDAAEAMGVPVVRVRTAALLIAVVCAASAVTVAGPISFVGLLAPIAMRRLGVRDHATLLPLAALAAAVLLLAADIAARIIAPPSAGYGELPVGVLAAILGGPAFVMLARKIVTGDDGTGATVAVRRPPTRRAFGCIIVGCAMAVVGVVAVGLRIGEIDIGWTSLTPWLADKATIDVISSRVPRILVAALAGAFLAVAGAAVQSVVRNPLAEPQLLGVTGGSALGAVAIITIFPALPAETVPIVALVGGAAALTIVVCAAKTKGVPLDPTRVVLIGIGVAATAMALVDLLVVRVQMQLSAALTWLSGSTYGRGMDQFYWLIPGLVVVCLLLLAARPLNMMALGEDLPRAAGLNLARTRVLVLAAAALLASLAAGAVGAVGFVGLVAPHLARRIVGVDYRRLILVAAFIGSALLVLADALGRFVLAPRGIPVGIVTAIVGGPYLVWLLRRTK